MTATIFPVGILKQHANGQDKIIVPSGFSVRQSLALVNIPSELVALVIVNGEARDKEYIVSDADQIKLFAVVGGG